MTKGELQALRTQAEANPAWATTRITNRDLLDLLNRIDSVERQLGGQQTTEMTPVTDADVAERRMQLGAGCLVRALDGGTDANGSPCG